MDISPWLHQAAQGVWLFGVAMSLMQAVRKERRLVRTTLESGAWVEHVPIQDIKGKHIRDYQRAGTGHIDGSAVDDDGNIDVRVIVTSTDVGKQQQLKHDALWAIILTGWSYEFPVPVFDRGEGRALGAEVLDDVPGDDYQEIDALLEPFARKLSAKPNPKGATTSSSNGSSKAKASGSHRG